MSEMGERIMFAILCMLGIAGLAALAWAYSSEARAGEPPAGLVPTLVMPGGAHVMGAPGWHPRRYASMNACRTQMALARTMTPPAGASEVLWQCLTYNPMEGQDA